jgi:hypothetical protein
VSEAEAAAAKKGGHKSKGKDKSKGKHTEEDSRDTRGRRTDSGWGGGDSAGVPPAAAALTVRILVQRPPEFDPRLQAGFASGLISAVEADSISAWVREAAHGAPRPAGGIAVTRRALRAAAQQEGGVEYVLTLLISGERAGTQE